jgi:hypothetical protein
MTNEKPHSASEILRYRLKEAENEADPPVWQRAGDHPKPCAIVSQSGGLATRLPILTRGL